MQMAFQKTLNCEPWENDLYLVKRAQLRISLRWKKMENK